MMTVFPPALPLAALSQNELWGGDRSFDQGRGNISFNVYETDQALEVEASVPGVQKDDIKVNLKDSKILILLSWFPDILTVSAEKKFDREKKQKNYRRVEHAYGFFSRSVRIPPNSDTSNLSANLESGILKISIPKTEKDTSTQEITITEGSKKKQIQEGQGQQGEQKELGEEISISS